MSTLVLSVVGSDRPGLTQTLAAAVLSVGGNWLESHLSRLGGLYVGSVLVEIPAARVEALRTAISGVDAAGLQVRVAPAETEAEAELRGEAVQFALVGQDRPGIVKQVTATLAALGVNIESFDTHMSTEPHAGASLFHLDARLRLPPDLAVEAVQAALEAISGEIMVDVAFSGFTPPPA